MNEAKIGTGSYKLLYCKYLWWYRIRKYCACLHFATTLSVSSRVFSLDSAPQNYDRLDIMKKAWIYKRKKVKDWWAGWYESGERKAKALPSKELAEHFKQIKYTQLNSDVFTGQKNVSHKS